MKNLKNIYLIGALALILVAVVLPVQAYNLLSFNWAYLGAGPTVNLYVNPNCADPSAPNELSAMQNAMNTWTNCIANFNFSYAGATSATNWNYYDFQNTIFWSAESGGGALASTMMWYNGANMTQADTKFYDNSWTWSTASSPGFGQFDVESVGLHEIGHTVGLDHSQYSVAVMYYAISPMQVKRVLNQDDINGIVAIYGTGGGPALSTTITPTGSTSIPSSGGSIPYTVIIQNVSGSSQFFDAWTEYLNSQGQSQGLIINRPDLTLGSGGTINRSLVLTIAGSVPNGNYTYYVRTAYNYPTPIIDEDSFPFTKGGDDGVGPWVWETTSTGWDDPVSLTPVVPDQFRVNSAYPNPFNPETTIQFDLPQTAQVHLTIFDMQGRQVADLLQGTLEAGQYNVQWNAANQPSGTYLYRLSSNLGQASGTLVLLK